MSFSPGGNTPWDALSGDMAYVQMRCQRCGQTSPRRAVPVVPSAFGAAKPRLPLPPKRCKGCHAHYPPVEYLR